MSVPSQQGNRQHTILANTKCFQQLHWYMLIIQCSCTLTESLYGTTAAAAAQDADGAEPWLANVDMTLSNVISDLSTSAALEQLSVH